MLMDPLPGFEDTEQIGQMRKGFRAVVKSVRFLGGRGGGQGESENMKPAVVWALGSRPSQVNFVMKLESLPDKSPLGIAKFRLGVSALILSQDEGLPEGLMVPEDGLEHAGQVLWSLASSSITKRQGKDWKQGVEVGLRGVDPKKMTKAPHLALLSTTQTRLLLDINI